MSNEVELSEIKSSQALQQIGIGGPGGGLSLPNMDSVSALAQMMSKMGDAVPKHLQGKAGPCAGVIMQAVHWEMDPFVVANKSYLVNGRIAFEAQLIHAVINRRAPITSIIRPIYEGEGDTRTCTISAKVKGEEEPIEWKSPEFQDIQPKNSPLWKTKPDVQLFYNTVRDWCRMYFPDVILGVYTNDELIDTPEMKNVTPQEKGGNTHFQKLKKQAEEAAKAEGVKEEDLDEKPPVDISEDADQQEQEQAPDVEGAETVGEDRDEAKDSPEPDQDQEDAEREDPDGLPETAQEGEPEEADVDQKVDLKPDAQSAMYQEGMDAAEFFGDDHTPPAFRDAQEEVDYMAGHAEVMDMKQ